MSNYIRYQPFNILRLQVTMLILLMLFISWDSHVSVGAVPLKNLSDSMDLLAYWVKTDANNSSLMLYDPQKSVNTPIVIDNSSGWLNLSRNGRLAFPIKNESNTAIYVWDWLAEKSAPANISQSLQADAYPLMWSPDGRFLALEAFPDNKSPLIYIWDGKSFINVVPNNLVQTTGYYSVAWSPDGHYLAFVSYHSDRSSWIHIWDGKTTINITPRDLEYTVRAYSLLWSAQERLAITVDYNYDYPPKGDPSEIYLWDGKTTTNLSQNPTGEDRFANWSTDGRLAYLSARNKNYDIFVWDGMSFKNGVPDVDSFTNISPQLTDYYSFPVWTNKDLLTFTAQGPQDPHVQVYLWDGKTETNISQSPTMHNGSQRWSTDGRWAFATFFSPEQLVYVRDVNNRTILTTEGRAPSWSPNGNLIFCSSDAQGSWVLSLWDGNKITEITKGWEISAQWQDGSGTGCSSG